MIFFSETYFFRQTFGQNFQKSAGKFYALSPQRKENDDNYVPELQLAPVVMPALRPRPLKRPMTKRPYALVLQARPLPVVVKKQKKPLQKVCLLRRNPLKQVLVVR